MNASSVKDSSLEALASEDLSLEGLALKDSSEKALASAPPSLEDLALIDSSSDTLASAPRSEQYAEGKLCPVCQSEIKFFFIHFSRKMLMCENTETCEYPFGYEDLIIEECETNPREITMYEEEAAIPDAQHSSFMRRSIAKSKKILCVPRENDAECFDETDPLKFNKV